MAGTGFGPGIEADVHASCTSDSTPVANELYCNSTSVSCSDAIHRVAVGLVLTKLLQLSTIHESPTQSLTRSSVSATVTWKVTVSSEDDATYPFQITLKVSPTPMYCPGTLLPQLMSTCTRHTHSLSRPSHNWGEQGSALYLRIDLSKYRLGEISPLKVCALEPACVCLNHGETKETRLCDAIRDSVSPQVCTGGSPYVGGPRVLGR